jgi:dolichyl-phosphate beta-glucosyltransferase
MAWNMSRNTGGRPLLSLVIPAYNEEERLPGTLGRVADFAAQQSYGIEVLVVDNASTDGTRDIVRDFVSRYAFMHYLYEGRQGKGAAVRKGMLAGSGDYLLICDADLAVPIEDANKLLSFFHGGCDIAIGSREVKGAKRYGEPAYRHVRGRVFNLIVQLMLLPGVRDSQCGFKCFTRAAASDLFAAGVIEGWAFDAEILYISRLRGYRVMEVPVTWHYGKKSKVNPLLDPCHMFREVLTVRGNSRRGIYDRNVNRHATQHPQRSVRP